MISPTSSDKMNKIIFFALFLVILLVTACTSSLNILSDNKSNTSTELLENVSIVLPTSGCVKEWKCISSGVKAYQYENCSYGERKTCANGCENNTCKATEVCTPGFKC